MEKRFSKNIKFEKNISVITKKIKLNRVLLIWVIENICKNAADAMKGDGKITINCTENHQKIQKVMVYTYQNNYLSKDLDDLLREIKELLLCDGRFDATEQALYYYLKKIQSSSFLLN